MIFEIFGPIPECPSDFGSSERFSPGNLRSEVGRPEGLWLTLGPPTSEPFGPSEISTEGTEMARAFRNWPKYFKNHRAENPRKISRGLMNVFSALIHSFRILLRCLKFEHCAKSQRSFSKVVNSGYKILRREYGILDVSKTRDSFKTKKTFI